MPGSVKTSSTTTVPPSRMPTCSPATVTIGISAFLSACLRISTRPVSPLAAAVRMYSERSTSSMQARVVRAMLAALAVPRHSAGSSMMVRFRAGLVKKSTHTTGGIQRR